MLRADETGHDHISARALFGSNTSYISWPLGDAGSKKHVPQSVVKKILSILGIEYSAREQVFLEVSASQGAGGDDGYEVPVEGSVSDYAVPAGAASYEELPSSVAAASGGTARKLSKDLASWGAGEVKQFLREQGLGMFEETMQKIGVGSGKTFVKLKGELFPPGDFSEDDLTNFDAALFKLRMTSLRVDFKANDAALLNVAVAKLRDGVSNRQDRLIDIFKRHEENYMKCLRKILDGFKRPLMANKPPKALAKQDADIIFTNIQTLLDVHEALWPALLSATSTGTVLMSRPFLQHVEEMTRHYSQFGRSIDQAVRRLEQLDKGPLHGELERLRKPPAVKDALSLKRLLTIPALHVRRYPQFLDALLKALPDYHADEQELVRAKTAMDNLVVRVNNQQENRQELLAVEARLEGYPGPAPLQNYAPLLRDGDLLYIDSSMYANGTNPNKEGNESYIFLLQKAMVITSTACSCREASRCQHKRTYQGLHTINPEWTIVDVNMSLWPVASQHKTYRFGFGIKANGRVIHEFAAKSLPAKRKWKVALKKCLPAPPQRVGTRKRAPSTPNQNASAKYFTDGADQPTTIVAKMMSIVVQDNAGVPMREGTAESFVGSYDDLGSEAIQNAGIPMREGTAESFVGSYNDLGSEAIPVRCIKMVDGAACRAEVVAGKHCPNHTRGLRHGGKIQRGERKGSILKGFEGLNTTDSSNGGAAMREGTADGAVHDAGNIGSGANPANFMIKKCAKKLNGRPCGQTVATGKYCSKHTCTHTGCRKPKAGKETFCKDHRANASAGPVAGVDLITREFSFGTTLRGFAGGGGSDEDLAV